MEGCDCLVLRSPELRAGFAPGVGMVGYTLSHHGEELFGQRGGLAAYRERGSSFGLPLLHPWANRLSRRSFDLDGRRLELDPSAAPVRLDANGLPIHGLLTASPDWELGAREAGPERATLEARLDFGAGLLAAFPFPHRLELAIELAGAELSVVATLSATADVPVPLSFGWHPYLTLPGVPRADWHVELPVRTRAVLDAQGIPTGREEPAGELSGPLGAQTWDDLFTDARHAGGVRARGRRAPHRGRVRGGLPGGAGLRASRRGLRVLRADDRAHRRPGQRRGPAPRGAGGERDYALCASAGPTASRKWSGCPCALTRLMVPLSGTSRPWACT